MAPLSIYLNLLFALTAILTAGIFYKASNYHKPTLIILLAWLALQAALGLSGFYTITDTTPPHLMLLLGPPLVFIAILFIIPSGRWYILNLNAPTLTLMHTIRIAVELFLYCLFIHQLVPKLMTFEGRNFDILSGLSAPVIFFICFVKKRGNYLLLIWNVICLGLVLNISVNAVLSTPSVFQQFGFDQPNKAILYFPFVWLPGCIVPLVLFAHLAVIKQILHKGKVK